MEKSAGSILPPKGQRLVNISVIVPTYNRPELVERLLATLARCNLPDSVEIVIVENGPARGVKDVCSSSAIADRVRYEYVATAGRSLALNHAIQTSRAEFFIFFDDDIFVPPNIVADYAGAAERYGPGHFFGGPLDPEAEIPCPPYLVPYLPLSAKGWSFGDRECEIEPAQFGFFFGANWAVFRADLERIGTFSEALGVAGNGVSPLGEEVDLQRRLLSNGAKAIYLPSARIRHPVPAECYTLRWVWQRMMRIGVTEWRLNHRIAQENRRTILGVPAWTVRMVLEKKIDLWKARLANAPIERRIKLRMDEAFNSGMVYGAWLESRERSRSPSVGHRLPQGQAPSQSRQ